MLNKKTDDVRQPQNLKGYDSELEAQISETISQLRKLLGKFARPRKTGQLLETSNKSNGGRPPNNRSSDATGFVQTLDDIGISKDQSSRWQKLADISDKKFESYLTGADKPSTAGSRTWRNGMQRLGDVRPLSELRRGLDRLESLRRRRND